jgi:hypothetical protein
MLIVGYSFGIRSERRLCEEVHLNLAYRWFCRLGLEDAVPDHSTFSKNRHGRFRESDAFRQVFEGVVARCMKEGLVGGEGFAIDASVIKADANRSRSTAREGAEDLRDPQHATRAVREYLFSRLQRRLPWVSMSASRPALCRQWVGKSLSDIPAADACRKVSKRESPSAGVDPLLSFEFAGSGRSNRSGKETLKGQVERRNARRERCERKQKRRPALYPLERVVTTLRTRAAP